MSLIEIAERLKKLKIKEERFVSENYIEMVFLTSEKKAWMAVLEEILGKPAKAEQKTPSREDLILTEKMGGVRKDQILFHKAFPENLIWAMLWPWQDGTHITLKMGHKNLTESSPSVSSSSAPETVGSSAKTSFWGKLFGKK